MGQFNDMDMGNKEIETIIRNNITGGHRDKRWTCLPEKMFSWTNDFSDVKCTDPKCTQVHPQNNEYYVPK